MRAQAAQKAKPLRFHTISDDLSRPRNTTPTFVRILIAKVIPHNNSYCELGLPVMRGANSMWMRRANSMWMIPQLSVPLVKGGHVEPLKVYLKISELLTISNFYFIHISGSEISCSLIFTNQLTKNGVVLSETHSQRRQVGVCDQADVRLVLSDGEFAGYDLSKGFLKLEI